MNKILVTDDEVDMELLIKQKFRKQIREGKYQFMFALNGVEALIKLKENPDIDIVLCDINMPEMDGLTLLGKMSDANPLVKSIMVSAYGDMDNIRVAMNHGAFDFICKPVDFEDLQRTIEKTITHVTQLKETIQAIKENNILKMYVDGTVLNFMNTPGFEHGLMRNETIEASVVFIDICRFTRISENESPDIVVQLLNNYFDVMVKEIIAHNGYIDKFIGDAIMAVFRGEYHLDRAIESSLSIRTEIAKINGESDQNFSPMVSIGINSGEMISGNIGSVNLRRLDYTVIGDTVNTAQRLQTAAIDGQILISESSYHKIKESFNCLRIGEINLKHKSHATVVYEVVN